MPSQSASNTGEFLLYQTEDGQTRIECRFEAETIWLGRPLIDSFIAIRSFYAEGMFALGQGFIYTCMILAGIAYYAIDRRFTVAAHWCMAGALLSLIGFTHTYTLTAGDVIGQLSLPVPVWTQWTTGYVAMAIVLYLAPYFTRSARNP